MMWTCFAGSEFKISWLLCGHNKYINDLLTQQLGYFESTAKTDNPWQRSQEYSCSCYEMYLAYYIHRL